MTTIGNDHDTTAAAEPTRVLETQELHVAYPAAAGAVTILESVNLCVDHGELVCIVGPSGSGKTTLLRCLAGLQQPTGGQTVFRGARVTAPPEGMAVVFQDYSRSLLPWFTIQRNVTLPLRGMSKNERVERAEQALDDVGLAGKGHLYPWQLSGGMQQRAAIARALAFRPEVLLMDEPFAAVDAQTRIDLEELVLQLRAEHDMTVLFVTHDIDEAVYLGDRVVVLSGAPTKVTRDIAIPFPSPRSQTTTKTEPEWARLRNEVFELIQAAKQRSPV